MYKTYTIMLNDTIETVAQKFGVTAEEIMRMNGLLPNQPLQPNSIIIIPEQNSNNNFIIHTVNPGESIYGISRMNNIDYRMVLSMNGLRENSYIYPGQQIILPKPNINNNSYITKEKDTLKSVANHLKVPVEYILQHNSNIYLQPNQTLKYK